MNGRTSDRRPPLLQQHDGGLQGGPSAPTTWLRLHITSRYIVVSSGLRCRPCSTLQTCWSLVPDFPDW